MCVCVSGLVGVVNIVVGIIISRGGGISGNSGGRGSRSTISGGKGRSNSGGSSSSSSGSNGGGSTTISTTTTTSIPVLSSPPVFFLALLLLFIWFPKDRDMATSIVLCRSRLFHSGLVLPFRNCRSSDGSCIAAVILRRTGIHSLGVFSKNRD